LEHCGPNNDDNLNYRPKKYINYWLKKCPVNNFQKYLLKRNILKIDGIFKLKKKIDNEIKESFFFADNSSYPSKNQLYKDIYA
jgi:pyruvate dehydrogenase E1 component alpha subunit